MTVSVKLVDQLWHRTYDLFQMRVGAHSVGPSLGMSQKFDQEVLNDIAALKSSTDIVGIIETIRGKFAVCVSIGLIGTKDADELHDLLDEIEGSK